MTAVSVKLVPPIHTEQETPAGTSCLYTADCQQLPVDWHTADTATNSGHWSPPSHSSATLQSPLALHSGNVTPLVFSVRSSVSEALFLCGTGLTFFHKQLFSLDKSSHTVQKQPPRTLCSKKVSHQSILFCGWKDGHHLTISFLLRVKNEQFRQYTFANILCPLF